MQKILHSTFSNKTSGKFTDCFTSKKEPPPTRRECIFLVSLVIFISLEIIFSCVLKCARRFINRKMK